MTARLSDRDRDPKRVKLFAYLPADCWRIIFSVLVDVQSFGRLACVCRETRGIATTALSDALRARLRGAEEIIRTGDGWGHAQFHRLPNGRLDGRYYFFHEKIYDRDDRDATHITTEYRNGRLHGNYEFVDWSTYRTITRRMCEFRDGSPWSGQLDAQSYGGTTTTTYTNGQRVHEHVILDSPEPRLCRVVDITWTYTQLFDGECYTLFDPAWAALHIKPLLGCRPTPPKESDFFYPAESDHRFALCDGAGFHLVSGTWGVVVVELAWMIHTATAK